jgi:hypothetical protein
MISFPKHGITLQPDGRGTRSQVWLGRTALYSSSIARRQFGSARASRTDVGIGESCGSPSVAERARPKNLDHLPGHHGMGVVRIPMDDRRVVHG